jgi:hypothetical protein
MSKFRRPRQRTGTTRTVIPTPASLNPYQETDAEKAASTVHGDNKSTALDRWAHRDGTVIYVVPGLEPDTAETLERDGLIETDWGSQRPTTKVFFPNNSRVLAWQMTVNEACRRRGVPEMFPGVPAPNLSVTGTEARAMSKHEVVTALTKGGGD